MRALITRTSWNYPLFEVCKLIQEPRPYASHVSVELHDGRKLDAHVQNCEPYHHVPSVHQS